MSRNNIRDVIRYDNSDPKRLNEAVKYKVEASEDQSAGDYFGFCALILSAITYLFKSPIYGVFALFLSLSSVNSHRAFSASARDSPAPMWSGFSTLIFASTAIFSVYFAPKTGLFNLIPPAKTA